MDTDNNTLTSNKKADMPGFFTYREVALMVGMLSRDEAGEVYQAVCSYFLQGVITAEFSTDNAQLVYGHFMDSLEKQRLAYDEKCEKNRQSAKKQWSKAADVTTSTTEQITDKGGD